MSVVLPFLLKDVYFGFKYQYVRLRGIGGSLTIEGSPTLILKGKKATCYPGFEDELLGAKLTGAYVEQAGTIVTGKGAGVAINFALKIVEMLKGKELAKKLAEKMIVK